jgi:membrane protease YdiL (CAAX protease family)
MGLLDGRLGAEAAIAAKHLGLQMPEPPPGRGKDSQEAILRKVLREESLTESEKQAIAARLRSDPKDWWLNHLSGKSVPLSAAGAAGVSIRWLLVGLSVVTLLPALWLLALYPWPRFIWAERIQALWSLPQILLAMGIRGVGTLAGRWIIGFVSVFLVGALHPQDEDAALSMQMALTLGLGAFLALLLVWMVKEIVGGRSARLHEILGFDQYDLRDWRLWMVGLGIGLPLGLATAPVAGWLAQAGLQGHPLLDQLALSPDGYVGPAKLLFVLQMLLLAPFVEEVVYRGFLLSALRNWAGPVLGAVMTSALFAIVHP